MPAGCSLRGSQNSRLCSAVERWPEVFLKIPTLLWVVMQISARVLAVSTERTNFNSSSHRDIGAAARDDAGNMRGPALVSGDPLRQIGFPVVSARNAGF